MKYDLNFYTKVYDNFLEPQICDEYIKLYEETLEQESDVVKKNSLCYTKEGEKICQQCTCQRLKSTVSKKTFLVSIIGLSCFHVVDRILGKKWKMA